MKSKFFNFRLALLVALLLPAVAFAQRPIPNQTTVDNAQQITVYDSTRPVRDRNLRITVGLLRGMLPATIEAGQCVQGNGGGTELIFGACGTGGGGDITAVLTASDSGLTGGATSGNADLAIAASAITNVRIATDAVTRVKMANNSIGEAELITNSVGASEIQTDAVRAAEIQASAVGTSEIANNAVTSGKIASSVSLAGNPTTTTQATSNNSTRIATTAFVHSLGGGSSTFVDLTDTPAAITADQCVIGNAGGTALVFGVCGTGGTADGVVSTAHLSTTGRRQLDLTLQRTNGLSNLQTGINLPIALWAVEDNANVVGTAEPFRIGTGSRDGTRFLRDDGAWSVLPGGGGDGVVDSLDFAVATRVLTASRTDGLADLTATLPGDGTGPVESLPAADVTYSNNGAQIDIDGPGSLDAVMGQIVAFQYRGAFTASSTGMTVAYNGHGANTLIIKDAVTRRQMTLNDFTQYDYMMVQKASPDWIMVGGSQHIYRFAHTAIENDGTEIIENASAINFATGVTATVSGETVTVTGSAGGTADGVVDTVNLSTTGARQLDLTVTRTNSLSDLQTGINLPIALWAVEDNADVVGTADPFRIGTGIRDGTRFLRDDGAWTVIPGGGGGTNVVANPGGSPSDDLTTVTIDGTDYSIVGGEGTVAAFRTSLNDLTRGTLQSTWEQILDFDTADEVINEGGFIRYSDGTGRERVEIPADGDGLYLVAASISLTSTLNNQRYTTQIRFTLERAGVETAQPEIGSCYDRGSSTGDSSGVSTCTATNAVIYELEAGDRIGVQDRTQNTARQHNIVGAESFVQIWRLTTVGSGGGGGGGTGDITGVLTAATGGLTGGVTVGTADLAIDLSGVAVQSGLLPSSATFLMQTSGGQLRSLTTSRMLQAFRQESGPYDNGQTYEVGDIMETGTGRDLVFWIASMLINAGGGEPSFLDPRNWRILATAGSWRGEVDVTETYELHEGDVYHIGDEVYMVTEDIASATGDGLREGDHIEEISNPHFQDEGTELTDAETVRVINCVGAGVDCSLDALGTAQITVQADITAVTTAINSGLEGGDTDGGVALLLDVSNLQSYISTISSADHVALSDEGEAGDPTRRLSLNQLSHWQSLQANGGIASTSGQFHIQANEPLLATAVADADRLIGWDQSAFATRAFEASTLRGYFRDDEVAANPGGSPTDTLTTVTIDGTDYMIEGGGGTADGVASSVDLTLSGQDLSISIPLTVGTTLTDTITLPDAGGGTPLTVTTTDIANVSFTEEQNTGINFTVINSAVDTGIAVPANTKTILANWGASTNSLLSGIDLPWYAMPIEEWERLEGVDAGDNPTKNSARFTRTWRDADITQTGATMARQIWIGKGNNGNIFTWSDNVAWDIYPFRARFEIHETVSVVTDVTGGGGGGSTTFEALTDTPSSITADQCVQGNTGGTALIFAACGSGAGDITAVTTVNDSGLSGGSDSGDIALMLDVKNLPIYTTPISESDHMALSNESETDDQTQRLSLDDYATWAATRANGGIGAVDGKFFIRANELITTSVIADADRLLGWDQSDGLSRTWELPVLRTYFRDGVVESGSVSGTTLTLARSVGADVTITGLPSGGGGALLTKAEAESQTDTTGGLVSGLLLYDAVAAHASGFHSILQVSAIPDARSDELLYLTHDYTTGGRSDISITPSDLGFNRFGYSNGDLFSAGTSTAVPSSGCINAIVGTGDETSYQIRQIWSATRHCMDNVTWVEIASIVYPVGAVQSSLGEYHRELLTFPTFAVAEYAFNVKLPNGGYLYSDGVDDSFLAGLWEWDTDSNSYERLSTGGGGSSTFAALTDTPSTITADDCVQGNSSGTALIFGACGTGGGGGDITAVLTGSASGLTGGTTSGSANLAIGNLGVTTGRLASNAVTTNKIASGAVGTTDLANRAVTGGKIASSVGLAGNPTTTTQADSDDSTRIATTAFVQSVSGGGGGGGDITAVLTASGSGLEGGVTTGSADLAIADGAITNVRIANNAVTRVKIGEAAVGTLEIASGAVGTADLANDSVTITKIANDAVDTEQLRSGAVTSTNLASDAVTAGKIRDGAVETSHIANSAVTNAKIANDSITQQKISAGGVGQSELVAGAVTTFKIAERAVTQNRIASSVHLDGNPTTTTQGTSNNSTRIATTAFVQSVSGGGSSTFVDLTDTPTSITADECVAGNSAGNALEFVTCATGGGGDITAVLTGSASGLTGGTTSGSANLAIGNLGVTTPRLASNAVTTNKIASGAVGPTDLANNAVTSAKITSNAVTTAKLATDSVSRAKMQNNSVGEAELITNSVGASEIQTDAVRAAEIQASAVGTSEIANGTIRGGDMHDDFITDFTDIGTGLFRTEDDILIYDDSAGETRRSGLHNFVSKTHGRGLTILQSDVSGTIAVLDWARSGDQIDADEIAAIDRIGITIDNGVGFNNEFAGMRFDQMTEALKGNTLVRNGIELNVRNFGITSSKLGSSSVTSAKLATDAVTQSKIADNAVDSARIVNSSITSFDLANNAVTSAKISNNAVTDAKIATNAVGSSEIKAFAVNTAELAGDAVTQSKIADAAVGVDQLKPDAVTMAKIADNAVGKDQIRTGRGFAEFIMPNASFNEHCYSFQHLLVIAPGTTSRWTLEGLSQAAPLMGACVMPIFEANRETGAGTLDIYWDYMTSSDNPSVWVLLDADGAFTSFWESEDPIPGALSPLGIPQDDDGNDLPGYAALDVGLPDLDVVMAISASLTSADRTASMACAVDYYLSRGWIQSGQTISDVPARYEPSSRQWLMRCMADIVGESVGSFYRTQLVVTDGAWVRPTP